MKVSDKRAFRLAAVAFALYVLPGNVAGAERHIVWKDTFALETVDRASWARLVKLRDNRWLAGYAVFNNSTGSRLRIKQSDDDLRSWKQLTEVAEPGRQLDNANLLQLTNGDVLLAMRSLIPRKSYRVQVYRSTDGGRSFRFLSIIDRNEKPNNLENVGVWEPFLLETPDGKVAAFYANEMHSAGDPSYSQVISTRVSSDGGASWGEGIRAVAERGKARPGEPNVVRLPQGRYMLFYEVCGTERCAGHYSLSDDGLTWSGKIGGLIPGVYQNPQGLSLSDGTLIVTSNSAEVVVSEDAGKTWANNSPAFESSQWGALYQTGAREIALVTRAAAGVGKSGQLLIRIGTLD